MSNQTKIILRYLIKCGLDKEAAYKELYSHPCKELREDFEKWWPMLLREKDSVEVT